MPWFLSEAKARGLVDVPVLNEHLRALLRRALDNGGTHG